MILIIISTGGDSIRRSLRAEDYLQAQGPPRQQGQHPLSLWHLHPRLRSQDHRLRQELLRQGSRQQPSAVHREVSRASYRQCECHRVEDLRGLEDGGPPAGGRHHPRRAEASDKDSNVYMTPTMPKSFTDVSEVVTIRARNTDLAIPAGIPRIVTGNASTRREFFGDYDSQVLLTLQYNISWYIIL